MFCTPNSRCFLITRSLSYVKVSLTTMVTGDPTEGVSTTLVEYDPAANPLMLTVNVRDVLIPAPRLPDVGVTINQGDDGALAAQVNVLVPEFVSVTFCPNGLEPPACPVKLRMVGLTFIGCGKENAYILLSVDPT